jgi:hypothetical protein
VVRGIQDASGRFGMHESIHLSLQMFSNGEFTGELNVNEEAGLTTERRMTVFRSSSTRNSNFIPGGELRLLDDLELENIVLA